MGSLAANLCRTASQYADRTALKLGDQVLTYAGLDDASARFATYLRLAAAPPSKASR